MRLRLIEKLCTNFSLAPASTQGRCTEHNAKVHMHQHRTKHDSTDISNTEHNTKVQVHQTQNTWCTSHICTEHNTKVQKHQTQNTWYTSHTCTEHNTRHDGAHITYGSASSWWWIDGADQTQPPEVDHRRWKISKRPDFWYLTGTCLNFTHNFDKF